MDENALPPIALHLCLQQSKCKAVQDFMDTVSINTEEQHSPLHITKGKLSSKGTTQVNRNDLKQQRMSEVKPDMILTPSISVVLFLLDTDLHMSKMDSCRQLLGKSPWKFHHLTEVNTTKQLTNRIHGKQEFYELMPGLPLFSLSTTHFGKEILRINIVTYRHSEMTEFYSNLFQHPPVCVRPDFSYFTFTYHNGISLQLSLKSATKLMPYPTDNVDLVLTVSDLPKVPQLCKVSDELYSIIDPDENFLLIRSQRKALDINHLVVENSHCKQSDLVSETKIKVMDVKTISRSKTGSKRPDVIPPQDIYITSQSASSTPSVSPRIQYGSTRSKNGSPAVQRKSLVVCNKSTVISGSHNNLTEINNNESLYKRRRSIDVLESF